MFCEAVRTPQIFSGIISPGSWANVLFFVGTLFKLACLLSVLRNELVQEIVWIQVQSGIYTKSDIWKFSQTIPVFTRV